MMVINKDAIIMEIVVFPLPCTANLNQENVAKMRYFMCFLLVIRVEIYTFVSIL